MKLGDVLSFRSDLYFEGAVQADWFYLPEKASLVSENFVFHGKQYFGIDDGSSKKRIDTISLMEELGAKMHDENCNPLTLAIADYGTGKSHFAVTLGQLLSGPDYMPETFNKILDNISEIDQTAAARIRGDCDQRNFVMVINGMRDFNLHAEILKAAQKSLKLYGLKDDGLKKLNRSFETADNFFARNSMTFLPAFERVACKVGWSIKGDALIEKIKEELMANDEAFEIVNSVYKEVNGQEIQWDEGLSAGAILETLIADYCGLSGQFDHIVILFDEFGRYLEYASSVNSGKSGDSALQQVFEAAQNANGALQIINFIQSDIKTYLQRVDQTKNIGRYIGRYDASDKYYISSNLETVFANLIQRKNPDAFKQTVVSWQNRHEDRWQYLFDRMNRWLPTKGIWKNYELFRKVVVEGIYPMHPLSTFMLTQLSDYLQNRSSLTLVSQYINGNAETDISDVPFLVLPEELLKGDLYSEMLVAEQDGKQPSQQCIRYDNVLRKFGDKLPEEALIVLRSNLILRILRFKTSNYEEAKEALRLCCNLNNSQLDEQLHLLEDEYAILGFDDRAGCFDFMEESNGAHDFKILKKRLIAAAKITPSILSSIKIQTIAGAFDPQTTNFGTKYKISTNEWMFKQELMPIEEFDSNKANLFLEDWRNAVTSIAPKGRLIWLYANKETDRKHIEKVGKLSKQFVDKPIVVMLLNDAENRLFNALVEYEVLDNLDELNRQKYRRYYEDDYRQAEANLRDEFEELKKERNYFAEDGSLGQLPARLPIFLTDLFERVYPEAIPFWFDGFVTKTNNIGGKGGTYYCTIIKMLLSGAINSGVIHSFPSDVRNRIDALLMEGVNTSWKCITNDFKVIPPQEKRSRKIYELIANDLSKSKTVSCKSIFEVFQKPPYGMSEDVVMLMIALVCANLNYCLRIKVDEDISTVNLWKERTVIKDKKIDLDFVKKSFLIEIDVDASLTRFVRLFDRIQGNKNINNVESLSAELDKALKEENLPEQLEDARLLAQRTLDSGKIALKRLTECFEQIDDFMDSAISNYDFYNALKAMDALIGIPLNQIFAENGFDFDEDSKKRIVAYKKEITEYIDENINYYLSTMYCANVAGINTFRNHNTKVEEKLKSFGFVEYAGKVRAQKDKELNNIGEIKSRQDLKDDLKKFMMASHIDAYSSYMTISGYLKEASGLAERLAKYRVASGPDRDVIAHDFETRVKELKGFQTLISNEMSGIWDDMYEISSIQDIENLIGRIDLVMKKGLAQEDFDDFANMRETLSMVLRDLQQVLNAAASREEFKRISQKIKTKYRDEEMDFDVNSMVDDVIGQISKQLDDQEAKWRETYLSIDGKTRAEIHDWEEKTAILPGFLSEKTISDYKKIKDKAERVISEGKIEDVVYYFSKLQKAEKEECLKLLLERTRDA